MIYREVRKPGYKAGSKITYGGKTWLAITDAKHNEFPPSAKWKLKPRTPDYPRRRTSRRNAVG